MVADMTMNDHNVAMYAVKVAERKGKLSEYLRRVRRGHSVTVLDRETPIARLVPYAPDAVAVTIRRPPRGAGKPH